MPGRETRWKSPCQDATWLSHMKDSVQKSKKSNTNGYLLVCIWCTALARATSLQALIDTLRYPFTCRPPSLVGTPVPYGWRHPRAHALEQERRSLLSLGRRL